MENLENTLALGETYAGYKALKDGAALVGRSDRIVLRLSGRDPVGMLNAILTNDVPNESNLGAYAALLNPKGKIQTDLRVLKTGEDVLLDIEPEGAGTAQEILARYAPFSRVKLADLTSTWGVLGLYGPRAGELLGNNVRLAEHESVETEVAGTSLLVAGVAAPVSGFDLVGPLDALQLVSHHLTQAGAVLASFEAYETARVEAGIPRFGVDITPDNFPGESDGFLKRAVSFQKGCYPGQETVARMHYRGQPNKNLYRFELQENPAHPTGSGDEILQAEPDGTTLKVRKVGWISSVAPLRVNDRVLALGYLTRKADPTSPLRAEDATILALRPV